MPSVAVHCSIDIMFENTLNALISPTTVSGIGLHNNQICTVIVEPGAVGTGRVIRVNEHVRPIHIHEISDGYRGTTIGTEPHRIRTIEHLLAALEGLKIHDVMITVMGDEVPILDGSSIGWVQALEGAGLRPQPCTLPTLPPHERIEAQEGDSWIFIEPADETILDVSTDFPHPGIGSGRKTLTITPNTFKRDLAGARTFGLVADLEQLNKAGLARGASLNNCLAFTATGLHPQQKRRWPDETLRHKMLDLLGDLALMNQPISMYVRAHCPSHYLTHKLLLKWCHQSLDVGDGEGYNNYHSP